MINQILNLIYEKELVQPSPDVSSNYDKIKDLFYVHKVIPREIWSLLNLARMQRNEDTHEDSTTTGALHLNKILFNILTWFYRKYYDDDFIIPRYDDPADNINKDTIFSVNELKVVIESMVENKVSEIIGDDSDGSTLPNVPLVKVEESILETDEDLKSSNIVAQEVECTDSIDSKEDNDDGPVEDLDKLEDIIITEDISFVADDSNSRVDDEILKSDNSSKRVIDKVMDSYETVTEAIVPKPTFEGKSTPLEGSLFDEKGNLKLPNRNSSYDSADNYRDSFPTSSPSSKGSYESNYSNVREDNDEKMLPKRKSLFLKAKTSEELSMKERRLLSELEKTKIDENIAIKDNLVVVFNENQIFGRFNSDFTAKLIRDLLAENYWNINFFNNHNVFRRNGMFYAFVIGDEKILSLGRYKTSNEAYDKVKEYKIENDIF
ncbi:hypothetical protein [Methanobrevibacter sp.]|uniref:hypothetical protein n=1 Tax=Methanobrevibacter sp. TaxID=66852 RepID=UPI0026DF21E1|nr:hypothetical protein [Methanobrevibacter sp.]